ncbi:MAG: sensor histidine kinase, partial [Sandaracinobacteroides sp.]
MSATPGWKNGTADGSAAAATGGRLPALRQSSDALPVRTKAGDPSPVRTQAVGLLAAGLAHDLNNMLGGIVATAELLSARGPRRASDARDLDAIVDQAVKASGLVRQILAFSRQDLLQPVTADLAQMVGAFRAALAAMAGRRARLEHVAEAGVLVRVDPTALERVLANLVLNARDAIGAGPGHIRLQVGRVPPGATPQAGRGFMPDGSYGAVSVSDDGPGVEPSIAGRIFDPYFTTRADGQGLGLSTAYGLVKQSGGFLLHDTGPLGGARFTLYLPEAAQPLQRDRAVA